jgi:hypothetical protein
LVVVAWLATRALLVWLLLGPQEWVSGDVSYFDDSLAALGVSGLSGTLVEYPLPAVGVLGLPWLVAQVLEQVAGVDGAYGVLLMVAAGLTDLAFTVLLARAGRGALPVLAWLLAVPLLGATAYARFDLLPGVLCGVAVLLVARHPRTAAACVAVATGIKLWPALVVPPLLAVARPRRAATIVLAGTGLALATVSAVLGGWDRLVSPLTYQTDRGLQIESVLATPAMLGWWHDPARWVVAYAPSKSYEVSGPMVDLLLGVSTLLSVWLVVGLVVGWGRLWQVRDRVTGRTALWLALAAVLGFVVAGKVFSPQYLLWVLPAAAAGLAVADSRLLRAWTAGLLLAAGLTQVVFPAYYGEITLRGDRVGLAVGALALRNVVVLALLVVAAVAAYRGLRADAQRGIALERQPPGPAWSEGRALR